MRLSDALTIAVGALGLAWLMMVAVITLLVRVITKGVRMQASMGQLQKDLAELMAGKDKVHQAILDQIRDDRNAFLDQLREDRQATNARLTWLERRATGS